MNQPRNALLFLVLSLFLLDIVSACTDHVNQRPPPPTDNRNDSKALWQFRSELPEPRDRVPEVKAQDFWTDNDPADDLQRAVNRVLAEHSMADVQLTAFRSTGRYFGVDDDSIELYAQSWDVGGRAIGVISYALVQEEGNRIEWAEMYLPPASDVANSDGPETPPNGLYTFLVRRDGLDYELLSPEA